MLNFLEHSSGEHDAMKQLRNTKNIRRKERQNEHQKLWQYGWRSSFTRNY